MTPQQASDFLDSILPNVEMLEGGLIFVLPEAQKNTSAMFPAQAEIRTGESTTVIGGKGRAARRQCQIWRSRLCGGQGRKL